MGSEQLDPRMTSGRNCSWQEALCKGWTSGGRVGPVWADSLPWSRGPFPATWPLVLAWPAWLLACLPSSSEALWAEMSRFIHVGDTGSQLPFKRKSFPRQSHSRDNCSPVHPPRQGLQKFPDLLFLEQGEFLPSGPVGAGCRGCLCQAPPFRYLAVKPGACSALGSRFQPPGLFRLCC